MTGRYEIGAEIGRGATTVVHRGRDLRLSRDVAVKVLRADRDHDPAFLARFGRQARDAARLNHPAIVAVYDTGELAPDEGGAPFVVMEFVDGRTLRAELTAAGPTGVARAVAIVGEVCAAVEFAHRNGIVHRGICPENVMLDASDAVKVMDFGMSRRSLTDDGPSAAYLSPEQVRGEPVDARSDVYGVGLLLFELLTGTPPFTGEDPVAVAYRQIGEPVRPPSASAPGVPADLDAVVLKALAKEPPERHQSIADLQLDLRRVSAGRPPTKGPADRAVRSDGRPAAGTPSLLAPPTTGPTFDEDDADDDASDSTGRRARRVAALLGFGLACAVTLAAATWLTTAVLTTPPPARPVAVPDLSGRTLDEARQILAGKDLTVGTVIEQESTQDQAGRIVDQRPSGHTEVTGRSPVNLVVGHGVSAVLVPDLVGLTADRARQSLSAVGLTYAEQQQPSADPDRGKVLAQSPAAHEQAPPGGTVTATVGTGLTMVTVPDGIVGVSVDDATSILAGAGLTAVGIEQDGTAPAGVVMAADHPPGQRVPEGSPVTLDYSNNALMVMPNLVGRGRDAAAALLRNQGWAGDPSTISVTSAPASAPNLVGSVVTQQPAAGAVIRRLGSTITVGIGVPQITMPALVGKSRGDAENLLRAAGAAKVTFADGGSPPRGQAGRVAAQSVPGGATIAADTPLVVTVYRS